MDYLIRWRSEISNSLHVFASLLDQDRTINIAYGIIAGGLLWPIRNDTNSPELSKALSVICGTDNVAPLLEASSLFQQVGRLSAAQALSHSAQNNQTLRDQLNQLLEYFRDDWLAQQFLKPATTGINITGNVEGTNVVIGGVQYVAGDLLISQTLVQQKIHVCPTAPPPPPHFVGRRDELDHLKAALSRGSNVAVTGIQGMGGIGKTALVLQLASEISGVGAVLWASLGPTPTVVNHLLNWAKHSDPDFEAGEGSLDLLASRVQANLTELVQKHCPGQVLVILDDVWEGDSVTAARLLQKATPRNSLYLITTRSQLVVAQLRSSKFELRPMSASDALQLLRKLLSTHPLIPDEVLLDLATVVGHHPLALELAAGQVTLLERPELEIGDLIDRYRGGIPEGDPFRDIRLELGETREDNLELVLSFSYDSLDQVGKAHFRTLGVMAYGVPFDQQLCRAVWETDPKPVLDVLRQKALLGISDSVNWYQQHPLLRAYARALLHQTESDFVQAADLYSEYVVGLSQKFNTLPLGSWNQLEPYVPHVEEVGSLLVSSTTKSPNLIPDETTLNRALSFSLNTSRLLANRRHLDHLNWLEMGLDVSRTRNELRYTIFFLNEIGQDNYFRGNQEKAIQRWYEAQRIAEAADDKQGLAQTYTNLGLFFLSSDPIEAPNYLRPASKLYEELQDPVGLVDALVHLSDWYASKHHPYEKREEGIPVLQRAMSEALDAKYERGIAEVNLKLGRLRDTLGYREEAVALLSNAVDEFHRLGQRDQEGKAHLFLASALANLGRYNEAYEHLEKALPLFKTTGYGPGQAVALRNLGELHAHQLEFEEALFRFGEALPIVSKVTMRFIGEDSFEVSLSTPFFSCQLEEVVKMELVERFRANAFARIQNDLSRGTGDPESKCSPPQGFIPDEVLRFLLTETILVKTTPTNGTTRWASALQDFSAQLQRYGEQFQPEVELASALRDVTLDRSPSIPEENFYSGYIPPLSARIDLKQESPLKPLLTAETVEQSINNTLIVLISQPESKRDWTIELRRRRRESFQWNDVFEHDFYSAQLAVLNDRLIRLATDNPYHSDFEQLLSKLALFEIVPLDFVMENTVAVKTVVPERLDDWLLYLKGAGVTAIRYGEQNERLFYEALVQLLNGARAELQSGNPYQPYLEQVKKAIAAEEPLIVPLPSATLASIITQTVAAKTTTPKVIDVVITSFLERSAEAKRRGRFHDVSLYDALLSLLFDEPITLPSFSSYQRILQRIVDLIGNQLPQPSRDVTIPQKQIDVFTRSVIDAIIRGGDTKEEVKRQLQQYAPLLAERDLNWDNEREFVRALLALLEGQAYRLPAENPYSPFVAQVGQEVTRSQEIHSKGGLWEAARVEALLRETAFQWKTVRDFMAKSFENPSDLVDLLNDHRMSDMVMAQGRWKEALLKMHYDLDVETSGCHAEDELLLALISVVDSQPVSLSQDNPYYTPLQEMLAEIEYSHGIPDMQVAALASSGDEFSERFAGLFSGKTYLTEKLEPILMNTVVAKTIVPENAQKWDNELERIYGVLKEQSAALQSVPNESGSLSSKNELEFIRALQAVLRDQDPQLSTENEYHVQFSQMMESIKIFHDQSASETLSGEDIKRIYFMTAGVMTIGAEHFESWKESLNELRQKIIGKGPASRDTLEFIDSLLIILQRRPTNLSFKNPYRPYLHFIQYQIKGFESE